MAETLTARDQRKPLDDRLKNDPRGSSGFPKEALPRIFAKFYRVPGTNAGGTGLGLSIARGFVEAHHGTIKAENNEEGGARFVITLPMHDSIQKDAQHQL